MRGDLEGSTTAWYKVLFAVWFLHSEAPHSAPNTQLQNQSLQEFSAGSNHLSLHYLLHSPVRTIVPARCLKWCYGQKQGQVLLDSFPQRTCSLYNFYSNVKASFRARLESPGQHIPFANWEYLLQSHSATSYETLGVSTPSETEMSNYSSLCMQELFPDFN